MSHLDRRSPAPEIALTLDRRTAKLAAQAVVSAARRAEDPLDVEQLTQLAERLAAYAAGRFTPG